MTGCGTIDGKITREKCQFCGWLRQRLCSLSVCFRCVITPVCCFMLYVCCMWRDLGIFVGSKFAILPFGQFFPQFWFFCFVCTSVSESIDELIFWSPRTVQMSRTACAGFCGLRCPSSQWESHASSRIFYAIPTFSACLHQLGEFCSNPRFPIFTSFPCTTYEHLGTINHYKRLSTTKDEQSTTDQRLWRFNRLGKMNNLQTINDYENWIN